MKIIELSRSGGDILAISKLILNGEVQMDVTSDTVAAGSLLSGKTATKNDGTKVTGTIASKSSSDLTASGATVTAPAGYYANAASKAVATATHPNPSASIASATGVVTASHTQGTGYVTGGTTTGTLSLTTQAGKTVTPTESAQTAVASYRWTTGPISVAAISSTYVGSGIPRRSAADLSINGSSFITVSGYYSSKVSIAMPYAYTGASITFDSSTGTYDIDHYCTSAGYKDTGHAHINGPVPEPWVIPFGTYSISSNGAYNISSYASVNVSCAEGVPVDDIALRTISVSGGIRGNASMISSYAFYGCYSIYSVSFPNATKIGLGAFAHCNHLSEMYFPAVTQIMAEAFNYCSSLRTISFQLVSSVGKSAFASCKILTKVDLPEALVIADYAFLKCSYLNTVRLPKVSLISYLAFSGCSRLISVYLNEVSQVPSTDYHDPFDGTNLSSSGQIYVPASLYQDFIVATYWSKYSAQMISV